MQQQYILGPHPQRPAILQFDVQLVAEGGDPGRTIFVQHQTVLWDVHRTSTETILATPTDQR